MTMTPKFEKFNDIAKIEEPAIFTGNDKLDEFWSADGGIVVGSAIFMTGTSGAGKTTISVFLSKLLKDHKMAIYSREMHRSSVKQQTKRLNVNNDNLVIADEDTCPTFREFMNELDVFMPKFVVIDSLQVISLTDYAEENQEDAQVKMIQELRSWTRLNGAVLFVIGHNTKEGEFRGSNTIMQLFDAHLELIHDKKLDERTISWGQKNRKGPLKSLYYIFTIDSVEFFTKEEWDDMHPKTDIVGFEQGVKTLINSNLKKFKKHPNFEAFQKACDEELKNIVFGSKFEEMAKVMIVMEKNERKFLK